MDFWKKQHCDYPALSDNVVCLLLPFVTTYLGEKGFSSLSIKKMNYRSRVGAEPQRLMLPSIDPDIRTVFAEGGKRTLLIRLMEVQLSM